MEDGGESVNSPVSYKKCWGDIQRWYSGLMSIQKLRSYN